MHKRKACLSGDAGDTCVSVPVGTNGGPKEWGS